MNIKQNLSRTWLLCAAAMQVVTSEAQLVTRIAAGDQYSLFLKSDGSLWGMGLNQVGQLGDGTSGDGNKANQPKQIVASNVTAIAASEDHSLFLKSDGSLWAMGANYFGQLGDGSNNATNRPEQIVANGVTTIAVGTANHSLFLKNDGSLWGMGYNQRGQLGDGTYNNTNRPEQIVASNVTAIAAGGGHSLFLKTDGSLWAMGDNDYGELGDGTNSNWTNYANLPELIVASNVTAISAGGKHSLFLKSDGSLWAMGDNYYGQLGDGTHNWPYQTNQPQQIVASNVTAISAGGNHSLFLKSDGSLWAMGANLFGELGDDTFNDTDLPEQIVASNVTAISAGFWHSLFIKSDGSLWGMGNNYYGALGDGTYNQTNRPQQIVAFSPPALGITTVSGLPVLTRPAWATNYVLQMTTNVASGNWVTVTNGIPITGLQITNASGTAFFRLQ